MADGGGGGRGRRCARRGHRRAAHPALRSGRIAYARLAGRDGFAWVDAWLGGMVGMNIGNTHLKAFEDAIERGELLVIVDVPYAKVEEITERVKKHHPQAELEGTEPTVPPFP